MKEYFKKKKDEDNFYTPHYSLISCKAFSDSQKLVLIVMLADLEMNNCVKWCQQTYADKTNKSRDFISKFFALLVNKKLLVPSPDNKVGSRYNTYTFNTKMYELLLTSKKQVKKNKPNMQFESGNLQSQSVNLQSQSVNMQFQSVNLQSTTAHIDNIDSIENTYLYREEERDDGFSPSPSSLSDEEKVDNVLKNINI